MTDEQARLKEHFLEPETRDGYFIDAKMKAAWKEMLNITEEIVRICDKHGLNYSLAGGTLLGAVRHKGFIPWDDDIDLDMPRSDYDKMLKIFPRELKKPYVLQTPISDPGRTSNFVQVRNPHTTAIDIRCAERKLVFNMGIEVDIFPIDGVPQTRFSKMRTRGLVRVARAALAARQFRRDVTPIVQLKLFIGFVLKTLFGRRFWFWLREWAFAANDMKKCRICGEYSFLGDDPRAQWPTKCHEAYLTMPFEYLDLKIPVGYDAILTAKYHDWRTPSKFGGYHPPHIIDISRSYKDVLVEKFGYKREWLTALP